MCMVMSPKVFELTFGSYEEALAQRIRAARGEFLPGRQLRSRLKPEDPDKRTVQFEWQEDMYELNLHDAHVWRKVTHMALVFEDLPLQTIEEVLALEASQPQPMVA